PERVADWLNLSTRQVEAAVAYVREHTVAVLTDYVKILERSAARGNPPELQAELDAGRARLRALVQEIRAVKERADAEIHELIRKHRAGSARERVQEDPFEIL